MEAEAFADFYPVLDAGKVDALFCGHIQCVRGAGGACPRILAPKLNAPTQTPPRLQRPPAPIAATTVRCLPRTHTAPTLRRLSLLTTAPPLPSLPTDRNLPYDAVTKDIDHASVSGPKNDQTYTDPRYMVNIVTGASGDKEGETCVLAAGLQPGCPHMLSPLPYTTLTHPPSPALDLQSLRGECAAAVGHVHRRLWLRRVAGGERHVRALGVPVHQARLHWPRQLH